MMKKRLLVIDDEISVAKQLKWGLGEDYEVTIAVEADQARPLLASGSFSETVSGPPSPPVHCMFSRPPWREKLTSKATVFTLSSKCFADAPATAGS